MGLKYSLRVDSFGRVITLVWALTHEEKSKGDEELKEPSKVGGPDAT